jgi:hypothetical protein
VRGRTPLARMLPSVIGARLEGIERDFLDYLDFQSVPIRGCLVSTLLASIFNALLTPAKMFNALFNKLPIALKTYVQKKLVKYESYELICVKMH